MGLLCLGPKPMKKFRVWVPLLFLYVTLSYIIIIFLPIKERENVTLSSIISNVALSSIISLMSPMCPNSARRQAQSIKVPISSITFTPTYGPPKGKFYLSIVKIYKFIIIFWSWSRIKFRTMLKLLGTNLWMVWKSFRKLIPTENRISHS